MSQDATLARVQAALRQHQPQRIATVGLRPAAVLVPLRVIDLSDTSQTLEVILTRRNASLSKHAGQVAFPGGHIDVGDTSPESAALREAHEELGVAPQDVQVLGHLDDHFVISGFHISPIVGLVAPDVPLIANAAEVARVFAVPLQELLTPVRWQQREHRYKGDVLSIWHFDHDGEDIWGATGHMLRHFVEIIWQKDW